jgi:hypothetical protein
MLLGVTVTYVHASPPAVHQGYYFYAAVAQIGRKTKLYIGSSTPCHVLPASGRLLRLS